MSALSLLDWIICGGYFVLVFGMSLWFGRRQRTSEQFFTGSRQMPWWAVGLSLFATTFSALSFVGLPREAAYDDYHLFLAILFIPLWVVPVVAWLFVPLYQRMRLTSAYEYLERRFNRPIRLVGSALFGLYAIGWMGSILYAVGVILQAMFALSDGQMTVAIVGLGLFITIYTALGGLEGMVWTDVVRSAVLVGSMTTVLFLAIGRIEGGWTTVWKLGVKYDKFQMFDFDFDPTVRNNFYSACAFGLFVYLAAHATGQPSVQRYLATSSVSAARRSLMIRGAAIAVGCLLFFLVGSAMFAYYHQGLSADAKAGSGFPVLAKQDHLLAHFVLTELAVPGLAGLLLAGLFAATTSTVDSGINSLTALAACDWVPGRKLSLRANRWLCVAFGIGVTGMALLAPRLGANVFDIIIKISGAFFGPLLGLFLLGMLVRGANGAAAFCGLAAGMVCLIAAVFTPLSPWWYGAITCVPTVLVGAGAGRMIGVAAPDPVRAAG